MPVCQCYTGIADPETRAHEAPNAAGGVLGAVLWWDEPVIKLQRFQTLGTVVLALAVTGVVGYAVYPHHHALAPETGTAVAASADFQPETQNVVGQTPGHGLSVRLSMAEQKQLGIITDIVRYNADTATSCVQLAATTALNPDTLAHVHPRFGGEAIEVKVRLGQRVKKGQTLAVIWSKDLGEKKSELIDARSQMIFNKNALDQMREPARNGAIPDHTFKQAQRDYESSRIAYERAYQTLISWRLTKDEIEHIEREKKTDWPRVLVEAPRDGTIVEKNVVSGELVDPSVNLFVVADLSRLSVWASALEGDLLKLHPGQEWTVRLAALPGRKFKGKIDVVGAVFDPTQHTVTVQGTIENKLPAPETDQPLRAGMYATATVPVPPDTTQVSVPTTALLDDGEHTYVYVESAKTAGLFERRPVEVQERRADRTLLRGGVIAGEKIVTRGCPEVDQKAQALD